MTITPGSPPAVAVDTNTVLDGYYREPLYASAIAGDLAVYWSPTIMREMAKVVYRENMLAALRSTPATSAGPPPEALLRQVVDRIADDLELQVVGLERSFRYAAGLDVVDETSLGVVADPRDRPVLRVALAVGAPFLLSLVRRHLPHGAVFHGVQCWHPDTFLTLFYRQNPDAFARAVRRLATIPPSIRRRLLP